MNAFTKFQLILIKKEIGSKVSFTELKPILNLKDRTLESYLLLYKRLGILESVGSKSYKLRAYPKIGEQYTDLLTKVRECNEA